MECQLCHKTFPSRIEIDGKMRTINKRKFCLECSPFGKHNTSKSPKSSEEDKMRYRRLHWKKYSSRYVVNKRRERKFRLFDYKGGKCDICGYNKRIMNAYSFHHLDPTKKEFHLSSITTSWERSKAEVDKCQLLCVRCHAEVHAEEYAKIV